ncbi:MAG: phosphatase PAP2 family protein [Calditrichaceae bacterium]
MFLSFRKIVTLSGLLLLIIQPGMASDNKQPELSDLFYNFGNNLAGSFTNGYGLYHISASALTYGLVKSDADWQYYTYMKENQAIPSIGMSAVIAGGLVPVTIPLYLYFRGKSKRNDRLTYSALAMGQSVIISLLVSSSYKAVTGRPGPHILDNSTKDENYSDSFHFGFLRRGIFEGWPSGHTMNAFAMAGALTEMYPDNGTLKLYSWIYAFFIGLGVSTNIHWFSDFAAGALIGYSIGKTVGKSFRNLYEGNSSRNTGGFYFTPNGIGYSIRF